MSVDDFREVILTVNGDEIRSRVPVRRNLVDFLRHDLGLTGTHVGCEHGVCGACSVRLDGRVVRGCLLLAVQADGAELVTIEGLAESGAASRLQHAFHNRNALQCGFCTPGMLLTAQELLEAEPSPSRERVREYLSGNLCRCTGYQAIIDAVLDAAKEGRDS